MFTPFTTVHFAFVPRSFATNLQVLKFYVSFNQKLPNACLVVSKQGFKILEIQLEVIRKLLDANSSYVKRAWDIPGQGHTDYAIHQFIWSIVTDVNTGLFNRVSKLA